MSLVQFVTILFGEGPLRVGEVLRDDGSLIIQPAEEMSAAVEALLDLEREYRNDLPGYPPKVCPSAALWAIQTCYRASSCLVYRDANPEVVRKMLATPCPDSASPSVCYSVDLVLRFLPDLARLAKASASNDPLLEDLAKLGRDWPLSSVGISDLGAVNPEPFLSDRCLTSLYVDRVIAAKDRSRLEHPIVRDAVRTAVGLHKQLLPEFAAELA